MEREKAGPRREQTDEGCGCVRIKRNPRRPARAWRAQVECVHGRLARLPESCPGRMKRRCMDKRPTSNIELRTPNDPTRQNSPFEVRRSAFGVRCSPPDGSWVTRAAIGLRRFIGAFHSCACPRTARGGRPRPRAARTESEAETRSLPLLRDSRALFSLRSIRPI